jgi:hypothetical protein
MPNDKTEQRKKAAYVSAMIERAVSQHGGTVTRMIKATGLVLRQDTVSKLKLGTKNCSVDEWNLLVDVGIIPWHNDSDEPPWATYDPMPVHKPAPRRAATKKRSQKAAPPPAQEPAALTGVVAPPPPVDVFEVISRMDVPAKDKQKISALIALISAGVDVDIDLTVKVN